MGSKSKKQQPGLCAVCIHANTTLSVNERTPLISSKSSDSSGSVRADGNDSQISQSDCENGITRYPRHNRNEFSWLLVAALFIFFFTGLGIATYLLFHEGLDFVPELFKLIPRARWNASPSNGTLLTINIPSQYVLLSDTGTQRCNDFNTCARIVQHLQRDAQALGAADIPYNFLIDDSGMIFEGLGFFNTLKSQARNHIIVALIGDYTVCRPTSDQLLSLDILLRFAVDKDVLQPCYKVNVTDQDVNKSPLVRTAELLEMGSIMECSI